MNALVVLVIGATSAYVLLMAVFGYLARHAQRNAPPEKQVEVLDAIARLAAQLFRLFPFALGQRRHRSGEIAAPSPEKQPR
ncbi:hypothetical protein [Amycolatopsis panacis]|uniref:Uncharacterized protein n=1 Tax=Amycolatopsis panacis TaxID=2340917 RepID=A0A419I1U9_9PSEU|nr:hypothetical protein [Amycolatopsis panacis]RJQ83750.1 hypothetical protein D5S19_18990 [Amycolatopsis panacis]